MNVRHRMGVLHSFSIQNIFYDKVDLRFFEAFIPITPSASLKYSYTRQRYYNISFKILSMCFGKSFI